MAIENVPHGGVSETFARTRFAVLAALRRRDGFGVFSLVTVLYLGAYLWFGNLLTFGSTDLEVVVARNPLATFFQPANDALSFEPVALVEFGVGTYLFSLNTLVGLGIAVLVGSNLAVTYLAWKQPKACGIGSSSGLLAGVPALLSGAACCGPIFLIAFGIQASSAIVTAFQWLIPLAVVLLVGSLLWVGRQVNPALA